MQRQSYLLIVISLAVMGMFVAPMLQTTSPVEAQTSQPVTPAPDGGGQPEVDYYATLFAVSPTPTPIAPRILTVTPNGPVIAGGQVTIAGTGEPGALIEVLLDGVVIETVVVTDKQVWLVSVMLEDAGVRILSVQMSIHDDRIPARRDYPITVVTPTPTPTHTPTDTPVPTPTNTPLPTPTKTPVPTPTKTPTLTPTPSSTPTFTPTPNLAAIVAAYQAAEASALANPRDVKVADLNAVATGEALDSLRSTIRSLVTDGFYEELTIELLEQEPPVIGDGVGYIEQRQRRTSVYRDQTTDAALPSTTIEVTLIYRLIGSGQDWLVAAIREQDRENIESAPATNTP